MSFNLPLLASASNAQQSSPKGYGLDKFHTPSKFSAYVTQATQPDTQDYVMARNSTMRSSLLPSNMAFREPQSPYSNKYTEKSPLFGNNSSPDRRMQNDEDALIYQAKRSIQETIMSNRASQARLINYSDPPPMFPKLSQNLQKSSDYSPEKPSKLPLIDAQPKRSIRVPNTLIVPNFDSPEERPSLKPRIIEVEAHEATPYHQKHKSLEPVQPFKSKFEEKPYIPKKLSFNMDTETQLQDLKKNGALVNLKKMDNLRKAETEESESEEEDEEESPEDSPFNVITDGSPTTAEKPQTGPLQVPTRFIGAADVYDTYNPLVKEAVVAEPRPAESIEEEDNTAISAKKLAVRMSRIQDMGFRRSTLINNAGGMSPSSNSSHSMPPPISEKPEPRASIVERKLKIQQRRERAAVEDQIEKNRIVEKAEFMKRRGKARRRVGNITWIMLAIKLFYEAKKKRVRRKTLVYKKEVIDKMVSNVDLVKNYLLKMVGQDILKILMSKEHEFVFVRNKKLKEHDQDLVCLAYTEQFKAVFRTLLENVKYIPPPFLLFLSRISKEECFIPDGFFSDFELQRLRFSLMGVLLRVSPGQSKLIIGGIILIRVLLYTIIMQPWYCFGKNKDEFDMNKLLNIGSVLYIASMDMFKDMAPVVQNDERLALLNVKVSAKQKPLLAIADPSVANKFDIKKDTNKEGDIMTGFYAKTQLGVFFNERKRLTFELKNTMNEWLDGVLEQVKNCKKVEIKEEKGNITVQTGSGTVKKPSNGTIKKSTFKKQSEKQAKEAKAN